MKRRENATTADAPHTPHSSHGAAGGQRSCAEPRQRRASPAPGSHRLSLISRRIHWVPHHLSLISSQCQTRPARVRTRIRALPWCLSTTSRQQPSRAAAALVLLSFVNRPASANSLGAIRTRRRVMMCGGVATGRSCSVREQGRKGGRRPRVALSDRK